MVLLIPGIGVGSAKSSIVVVVGVVGVVGVRG